MTHLCWGQYHYKIPVLFKTQYSRFFKDELARRDIESNEILETLGYEHFQNECYVSKNTNSIKFYFDETDVAEKFIERNKHILKDVYKLDDVYVPIAKENPDLTFQKNLFWNKFEWLIKFKNKNHDVIDQWVEDFFGHFGSVDYDQIYFSFNQVRTIYCTTEDDFLAIRLALAEHIASVRRVFLTAPSQNP